MSSQQRKRKFAALLQELLNERDGVKGKLAQELKISPARFTPWLQGKVDPAGLDILKFKQIAQVKRCSVNELAKLLGFIETEQNSQARFRVLLEEMLLDKTQEELAERLGISRTAISKWLDLEKKIYLSKISAGTMFSLAQEKKWTLDKLLNYLNLNATKKLTNDDLRVNILSARTICIILEQEDLSLASHYTGNLVLHLQLNPENIKIATPSSMPESLEHFDVLLFDINSPQSPCLPLVESLKFEGDIVIFADSSLPDDEKERLNQKATEVIVQPLPWGELKDLPYFS